jgi:hypothetical protein
MVLDDERQNCNKFDFIHLWKGGWGEFIWLKSPLYFFQGKDGSMRNVYHPLVKIIQIVTYPLLLLLWCANLEQVIQVILQILFKNNVMLCLSLFANLLQNAWISFQMFIRKWKCQLELRLCKFLDNRKPFLAISFYELNGHL